MVERSGALSIQVDLVEAGSEGGSVKQVAHRSDTSSKSHRLSSIGRTHNASRTLVRVN